MKDTELENNENKRNWRHPAGGAVFVRPMISRARSVLQLTRQARERLSGPGCDNTRDNWGSA